MQASRFVSTLALAAVAVSGYAAYRRSQSQQSGGGVKGRAEPLQRWESEGGGVPISEHRTAAQVDADSLPELDDTWDEPQGGDTIIR